VAVNLWFEHVIDAYLQACASGCDWREAVAEADKAIAIANGPRRVLTQKDLRPIKGIQYCRQRLSTKVKDGSFPSPFQLPSIPAPRRQRSGVLAATPRRQRKHSATIPPI
jgi:hypothetical protein